MALGSSVSALITWSGSICGWNLRIAIVNSDDWNSRRARSGDVAHRIPDHDRRGDLTVGARDGSPQEFRMGLSQPEGIRPTDGHEAVRQPERVEQPDRQPFELVGAHRQPTTEGAELVERRFEARERPRAISDMGCVIFDEFLDEPVYFGCRELAALGFE